MEEKIKKFMEQIPPKSKLLLAVSGGGDSMAMYHYFLKNAFDISVAHFDHQSRQGQSTQDAKFLQEIVEKDNVPFFLATAPVEKIAVESGQGFEECARNLRYNFFLEKAQDFILTAHHAGDNLETFLLNLCRGTGLRGLSGIPPVRGKILRPLLNVTKDEIEVYLQKNKVPYRTDESNFDEKYNRNLIRQQILPNLKKVNPKVLEHATSSISIIREENQFLDSLVEKNLSPQLDPLGLFIEDKAFSRLPLPLWGRGIRYLERLLREHFSPPQVTQIEDFLQKESPKHLMLSPQCRLYRKKERLYWETGLLPSLPCQREIILGEKFLWGRWEITVEELLYQGEKGIYTKKVPHINLRTRKEGDTIEIPHRAHYKVKKYLQMCEIPPWERSYLPFFITENQEIIALGDLAVSEKFLPQIGKPSFCIRFKRK